MKVIFISCYLTHHQIPFSEEMCGFLGNNYKFISVTRMEEERKKLGWISKKVSYELKMYESEEVRNICQDLIDNSDVVIIGSAPDKLIENRLKNNKLTFKYSERIYKEGINFKNIFRIIISAWLHHGRFQKYPLYMLCASAYTAGDLDIFKNYKNKVFKWGYFPETKRVDIEQLMKLKNNDITEILWVGRFIEWKHAQDAIEIANRLRKEGYKFKFTIIGNGILENNLRELVEKYSLTENIIFLGSMPTERVREYMERANIYLFTSDFQEGWGAVLNEAMNSGCAIVASHAIGSVPFLIKNYENGLIYKYGDIEDFYNKVVLLIEDSMLQKKLGCNAYKAINNLWNEKVAAKRFLELTTGLLNNKNIEYKEGPCSRAEIIRNDWL